MIRYIEWPAECRSDKVALAEKHCLGVGEA